jgi:hypothetical protein
LYYKRTYEIKKKLDFFKWIESDGTSSKSNKTLGNIATDAVTNKNVNDISIIANDDDEYQYDKQILVESDSKMHAYTLSPEERDSLKNRNDYKKVDFASNDLVEKFLTDNNEIDIISMKDLYQPKLQLIDFDENEDNYHNEIKKQDDLSTSDQAGRSRNSSITKRRTSIDSTTNKTDETAFKINNPPRRKSKSKMLLTEEEEKSIDNHNNNIATIVVGLQQQTKRRASLRTSLERKNDTNNNNYDNNDIVTPDEREKRLENSLNKMRSKMEELRRVNGSTL